MEQIKTDVDRRKLFIFRVVSIFIGTILGVAVMEAGARLLGVRPVVMDARMYVNNADPLLPYKLRPNYHDYYAGGEVNIESTGRRRIVAAPSGAEKAWSGVPRPSVLLLGASLVFGPGLDDDQTMGSRLKSLFIKNDVPLDVGVIGVPGYTGWNKYAALKEYEELSRTRVVIFFYGTNDVTFNNDVLKIRNGEMAIVSNTPMHRFLRWLYTHLYVSHLAIDSVKRIMAPRMPSSPANAGAEDQAALQYSVEALQKISDLCAERNINFVVALYRDAQFLVNPASEERFEEETAQAFRNAGIPYFLLKEHTDKLSFADARVAWNDAHPGPRASDLLAQQIYRELAARGWLERQTSAAQ